MKSSIAARVAPIVLLLLASCSGDTAESTEVLTGQTTVSTTVSDTTAGSGATQVPGTPVEPSPSVAPDPDEWDIAVAEAAMLTEIDFREVLPGLDWDFGDQDFNRGVAPDTTAPICDQIRNADLAGFTLNGVGRAPNEDEVRVEHGVGHRTGLVIDAWRRFGECVNPGDPVSVVVLPDPEIAGTSDALLVRIVDDGPERRDSIIVMASSGPHLIFLALAASTANLVPDLADVAVELVGRVAANIAA